LNDRRCDLSIFSSDLRNQVNDASSELGAFDAYEGFRERKPIRRSEEFGDIGWERCFAQFMLRSGRDGRTFKEERA
jgi:hypothetical protein